jgi:hypothetical protein
MGGYQKGNRVCCDALLYELHLQAADNEDRFREAVLFVRQGI